MHGKLICLLHTQVYTHTSIKCKTRVHIHSSTPDLPVAHTIRKLALCRDGNSIFLSTSFELFQIIEYLCTI